MVDRLLLHCSMARLLWDLLLTIFGVNWVFPKSVRETFSLGEVPLWGGDIRRLGWQHP